MYPEHGNNDTLQSLIVTNGDATQLEQTNNQSRRLYVRNCDIYQQSHRTSTNLKRMNTATTDTISRQMTNTEKRRCSCASAIARKSNCEVVRSRQQISISVNTLAGPKHQFLHFRTVFFKEAECHARKHEKT